MLKFVHGPAAGLRALLLRRAPLFLRVVRSPKGSWDALDQIHDEPTDGEQLWAYRRVGPTGSVHINRGRRGGSGTFVEATYEFCESQPDEATMRDTQRWQEWCLEQSGKPTPERKQ